MDSVTLLPIFTDLKEPVLEIPKKPKATVKVEGETQTIDEWDKIMYVETVRLYLKAKERTEATITSLYGVAWG